MRDARYRTTLDRVGWAIATGAGACGVAAAFLGWGSGATALGGLLIGLVGATLAAAAIVVAGAPLWLFSRWRGPVAAGAIGAGVAAALAVIGYWLGLPADGVARPLWAGTIATAAVAAFLGALVALAMWLVAYSER